MRSVLMAAICVGFAVVPARAQEQNAPATAQDSVLEVYKSTLLVLRDSTVSVRGTLNQFRRDLEPAGDATVINRATRLNERCASLVGALDAAEMVFRSSRAPTAAARDARVTFLGDLRNLKTALNTHCLLGLAYEGPGERADSLRSWGPYHTSHVQRALLAYDGAAATYAKAFGIDLKR